MTRKEALQELLAKVEAGVWSWSLRYDAGLPDRSYDAFHGSLDAAKALHEAVLPGWGWELLCGGHAILRRYSMKIQAKPPHNSDPARAWLIAIIKALISETEQ